VKAFVSGCAGFIGSHVVDILLREGWQVSGADCLSSYYDPAQKRSNLESIVDRHRFKFSETDLLSEDLSQLVTGVDVVFHLAPQPGVRPSWDDQFPVYTRANVDLTQKLLHASSAAGVKRVVYSSSSSVYGQASSCPTREDAPQRPFSPYGVTKLAGEHLCSAYAANFNLSVVSLRYFTVYGPRQRPDMAIYRMMEAIDSGRPFPVYGDGGQIRDFTYVGDVARANLFAATAEMPSGTPINVAGGGNTRLRDLIEMVGEIVGSPVPVEWRPAQPGDVYQTGGSIDRAAELLGWTPLTDLRSGLQAQASWHAERAPSFRTSSTQ
jgi:nucleoside-diphosphate-sugar epimerase